MAVAEMVKTRRLPSDKDEVSNLSDADVVVKRFQQKLDSFEYLYCETRGR